MRGFTLLELALAVAMIGVLAGVLLNRLHYYQELAEKAAMESTLRTIKTGLQVRLAELIVTNSQAEAPMLEAEDPVRWLDHKPPNYGGAYRTPAEPGTWYFDAATRQLVYVVNIGSRLELDGERGAREIRFRVSLVMGPIRAGTATVESVTGIRLAPVRPYHWLGAAPIRRFGMELA
jgi:prepilin-type N-terminal cleavage/methylation domain-containing protein